jgi:hypothetical protein
MARQFSMPYQIPPVGLLAPAADAAGRTSSYRSLKNALKAFIVAEISQGNAAQVTLTPMQATDVAGDNPKAINAVPIWLDADSGAADGLVAQLAAANIQLSAALKDKIVVFEIDPAAALDIAGGFDCVALQTSASNAANITEAKLYILQAYQGVPAPSADVN